MAEPISEKSPDAPHVEVRPPDHSADIALVQAVLSGSEAAWREFVHRYLGLISAVMRRYLAVRGEPNIQSRVADLLSDLYSGKLTAYEGRAALSTWLTLVARAEAVDQVRRIHGRRGVPRGLKRLAERERRVFDLYYVRGQSIHDVLQELRSADATWTLDRLLESLELIEREVDDRSLRRISYDLHAQSSGAASGRLLAYLDHVRDEFAHQEGSARPEYHMMEQEARLVIHCLNAEIAKLAPQERRLYTLRFERGWSARQIAEELGLDDTRVIYTWIDRLKRILRRKLQHVREQVE